MKKLIIPLFTLLIIFLFNLFFIQEVSAQALARPVEKLKITSPVDKTVWQLGNFHTISWSPNSDNPNIEAFFETKKGKNFQTYAKLLPCGKGSIIWCSDADETPNNTNDSWAWAKPGSYYVSIKDKITGEIARTNSPVKIVGRGEVIKLKAFGIDKDGQKIESSNDTQTFITLKERKISLKWSSKGDSCNVQLAPKIEPGQENSQDYQPYYQEYAVAKKGRQSFDIPGNLGGYYVRVICSKDSNSQVNQFDVTIENAIQHDLTIVDVTYSPSSPVVNDWITTDVTIKNNTREDVSGSKVVVQGTAVDIPTLGPSAQTVVTVPRAFSFNYAGTFELNIAIIDSNDNTADVFTNTLTFKDAQGSIKVLSPNGGEILTVGSNIQITWASKGNIGQKVRLNLDYITPNSGGGYLIEDNVLNDGSYTWKVPNDWSGFAERIKDYGKYYRIYACILDANGKEVSCDYSDESFTITSDIIAKASLTINSPQGGETFTNTQKIPIEYAATNISDTLVAYLYHPEYGQVAEYQEFATGTGKGMIELDLAKYKTVDVIKAGEYKIGLCDPKNTGPGGDKDLCVWTEYFTIINSDFPIGICTFNRDLTVGSVGTDVGNLQNFLISKGFPLGEKGDIPYFGINTQTALAQYQASVGISPADGYFGPVTRVKVTADCIGLMSSIRVLSPNGGENYKVGDDIVINWVSKGDVGQKVDIQFDYSTSGSGGGYSIVAPDTGSYVWKGFDDRIEYSKNFVGYATYNIRICILAGEGDEEHATACDVSDSSFTLISSVATSTTPIINSIRQPRPRVVLPATPSSDNRMITNINLEIGMTHPDVVTIQKYLNSNGYIVNSVQGDAGSPGYESDYFGEKTRQALIRFQKDKGISPAQGYFGPKTRAMMGI